MPMLFEVGVEVDVESVQVRFEVEIEFEVDARFVTETAVECNL